MEADMTIGTDPVSASRVRTFSILNGLVLLGVYMILRQGSSWPFF